MPCDATPRDDNTFEVTVHNVLNPITQKRQTITTLCLVNEIQLLIPDDAQQPAPDSEAQGINPS